MRYFNRNVCPNPRHDLIFCHKLTKLFVWSVVRWHWSKCGNEHSYPTWLFL